MLAPARTRSIIQNVPNATPITVRRGSAPYLLFPQSRLDASPDFEEVLEVDLEPRRQGIQRPVALVPQGHHAVVFAQNVKVMANRLVVQRESGSQVVRVVRTVVERPQNPRAVDAPAGPRD